MQPDPRTSTQDGPGTPSGAIFLVPDQTIGLASAFARREVSTFVSLS